MPRHEKGTRVRGWILKNTRIGPVLHMKVCCRYEQYSVEVQVPSLFQDDTVSWIRLVNGVDGYVTEPMLTKKEEHTAAGKPNAKARPRKNPTVTLISVSIPVLDRKCIDIETQRSHDHKCYEVSKAMTRLLRHDQSVLEEATEQSTTVTSSKSEGGRSSTMLRNGYLKIGSTLAKRERSEEQMSILHESKFFQSISVPSRNSRTVRR